VIFRSNTCIIRLSAEKSLLRVCGGKGCGSACRSGDGCLVLLSAIRCAAVSDCSARAFPFTNMEFKTHPDTLVHDSFELLVGVASAPKSLPSEFLRFGRCEPSLPASEKSGQLVRRPPDPSGGVSPDRTSPESGMASRLRLNISHADCYQPFSRIIGAGLGSRFDSLE